MLSEMDKSRIRAEEIYRQEVRSEINNQSKTKSNKIWVFLNSGFSLWFLSSILIAGGTAIYSGAQNRIDKKEKNRIGLFEMQEEIRSRVDYFESLVLDRLDTSLNTIEAFDLNLIFSDTPATLISAKFRNTDILVLLRLLGEYGEDKNPDGLVAAVKSIKELKAFSIADRVPVDKARILVISLRKLI